LEANFCFCEYCAGEFRNWLKLKYGSLELINQTYGNVVWSGEYSSWEQITPPFGTNPHAWLNPSMMLDFNRYASDNMIKFVKMQSEIIGKNCRDIQITTNTWFCQNMPDFYNTFEELDFVSYDNYPVTKIPEDKEELYSHAFHLDLMRGIKQKSFWIMEQLSGGLGCWMPMLHAPRPNMIKGYSLQAFAHGADTVVHFRWRTAATGAEMHWHGLIDQSNVPGRRLYEFEDLCKTAEKLGMISGTKIKSEVAILYSSDQEYAFKIQPQTESMYYFEQLKLFHDAFTKFGMNIDIINWSANLDNYKVVVAPTIYVTDSLVTKNLYEYVKNGGTLILTNRSGVKNEYNNYSMEMLPTVFAELIGAKVTQYDPIGNSEQKIKMADGSQFICTQWCDILETTTANVLASYADSFYQGNPAIIQNKYGDGTTYYVGTVGKKALYYDLIQRVLNECNLEYFSELPYGVEITTRESERDKYYFVFNNSDNACEVTLEKNMKDVLSGDLTNELKLQPYDMRILQTQ
ncbi:MAG TPA: beta-galactosidase, partial [Clostridiales bacterium]|nr:beta-galactosidase [Clostridiales bacterium]